MWISRGTGASSTTSKSPLPSIVFRTLDPQTYACVTVGVNGTPTAGSTLIEADIGGEKVEEAISTVEVPLAYGMKQAGPTRTLLYAAKGDASGNTYRNVLVRFENPIAYSLGKLTYTLSKAQFIIVN